jgi:hypothetical protein
VGLILAIGLVSEFKLLEPRTKGSAIILRFGVVYLLG